MTVIPLSEKIENYHDRTENLRRIAPSGYAIAINYTISGPEYFDTTFPEGWQSIYRDRGYFLKDPVFLWTLTHTGYKRWSEIAFAGKTRVMREAARFDMKYGAIFARRKERTLSWCTISRHDRQLTDREMADTDRLFSELADLVQKQEILLGEEITVLKAFANGLNQRQVAEFHRMSEGKVKNLVRSAKNKLGCKTLAQVVSTAVKKELI